MRTDQRKKRRRVLIAMIPAETIEKLLGYGDLVWGEYYLRRDPSGQCIEPQLRQELVRNAFDCSKEVYDSVIQEYGELRPAELASILGIEVVLDDLVRIPGYVPLARYISDPPKVFLSCNILNDLEDRIRSGKLALCSDTDFLKELALSHEIFHHIETMNPGIFTRRSCAKRKILGLFSLSFCPSGLSEIAAVNFSRLLTRLHYFPGIYEVVLSGRDPFEEKSKNEI